MSYVPAGNVNDGFWAVENWVQPTVAFRYAQSHDVGVLVDWSVNVTISGPLPILALALVNADTGVTAGTPRYTVLSSSSLPPALVAVRLMSYVPAGNVNDGFWDVANCVHPTLAFRYAHFHEVGVLVDVSVKVTLNSPVPALRIR